MKRKISLLCVGVLLIATVLSAFVTTATAADYTDFTVALEAGEVNDDGTFIVDVVVYNNPGIAGYEFTIGFDNTQIQVVDVIRDEDGAPVSVFPTETTLNIDEDGVIPSECSEFRAASARAKSSTKNGSIVSIVFKFCNGATSADLYFENMLFVGEDSHPIDSCLVDTTVKMPAFNVALVLNKLNDDDTFIVDVVIGKNPGVSGYEYTIGFDNTKIQIVDVVRDEDDIPESVFPAEPTLNIDEEGIVLSECNELRANAARARASAKNGTYLSIIFKFCEGEYNADLIFDNVMFVNAAQKEIFTEISDLSVSRPEPDYTGQCGDDAKYEFFSDTGLLRIKGSGDMWDFEYKCSPWYDYRYDIQTVKVLDGITSIGDRAFSDCSNLMEAYIADSVCSIGEFAFADSGIGSVAIPENVTSIGDNAFQACYNLIGIDVDADNAAYCDVDGVLFTKDMKTLLAYPCGGEIEYVIPDGVDEIGDFAFARCFNLTNVTIPDSVTRIGRSAFTGCESLVNIAIPEGVTVIEDHAFSFCYSLASFVISENVTKIGDMAFESCYSLENIVIPENVESIGKLAFQYSGLQSATFKSKTVDIGSMAFHGCDYLDTIYCYRTSTADEHFGSEYTKKYMDIRTVSYLLDGGTGEFAPQSAMEYEEIAIYSAIPVKLGYEFIGWLGCDEITYNAGDIYTGAEDLILTAQWLISNFTISFDANGGEGAPGEQIKNVDVDLVLSEVVPTRDGYRFIGWATTADGEVVYVPGGTYSENANVTLYAVWEAIRFGDANDDTYINAKDAVLLAQYLAGWDVKINLDAADCNGDDAINAKDAVLLAQYLAGWDVTLG